MSKSKPHAALSKDQRDDLLETVEERFEKNWKRHPKLKWEDVYARLSQNARALWSLSEMERTGGEPDVIGKDEKTGEFLFCDCSPESPMGRRSVCYDPAGQKKREKEGEKKSCAQFSGSRSFSFSTFSTQTAVRHLFGITRYRTFSSLHPSPSGALPRRAPDAAPRHPLVRDTPCRAIPASSG